MTTKLCRICKIDKDIVNYNRNGKFLRTECKSCEAEIRSRRGKVYSRKLSARFLAAKQKAKLRGIYFTLSFEEYEKIASSPCYYCDGRLGKVETGSGLDRLDSDKGYSKENVVSCCKTCNFFKNNLLSAEEAYVAIRAVLALRDLKN